MTEIIKMKKFRIFLRAMAAGVSIGLGAAAYLMCENKLLGAFMFTVGLFTICFFALELYTGRIGYILEMEHPIECLIVWLGNITGCILCGGILRYASPRLAAIGEALSDQKLSASLPRAAVLGMFCGILMYIAVHNYRENPHMLGKCIGVFVCIPAFIFCGFEHSIANVVYFTLGLSARSQLLPMICMTLAVSAGNAIGAIAFRKLSTAFQKQN